jgi:diguanylate cyclase (GGDEF)-like protein
MTRNAARDVGTVPASRANRTYTGRTINQAFNDFLRLQDVDHTLLGRYRAVLRRDADRFAKLFYDYLLTSPATAEVLRRFEKCGGKIEDLVRRQTKHLFSLLAGDVGEESARHIIDVGEIHQRYGIEPVWISGAYLLYLDHLKTVVRSSPEIEDVDRAVLEISVTKLLFRDMGLALEGYWSANVRDLDREKTKVDELQTQITSLLSNLPQVLWSVDVVANRPLYISDSAREICQVEGALPIPCWRSTVPKDREEVKRAWEKALRGQRVEIESRVRGADGKQRWFRRVFCPFIDADGKVIRIDGLMEDTTDTKQMLQQLRTLATTDALTGLPNRALFQDRFNQAIHAGQRDSREVVLVLMDLDHFKEINDTLGHGAGDEILCTVARRLSAVLRQTDTLARLGGDEFAILLADVADGRAAAERFIKKVLRSFAAPFQLGDNELFLRAGVGIVVFPHHGDDAATLLSHADIAMYGTKNRDIDYLFYDAALDTNVSQRLQLSGDLRRAIEREELVIHYQPKADFRTRQITSVEALIRWNHARLGLLPPEQFIGVAERTGFIRTITYWTIATALRQLKAWRDNGIGLRVGVNVPGRAFRDPDFVARIQQVLRETRMPASSLEIEITENTLMSDIDHVRTVLSRLARLGVCIAIDDFGTGYCSLAMLGKLPLHTLKIDKSFVLNMANNDSDAMIVRSTIDLGHNLGCKLVAEGIENEETWELLSALGCDDGQGFLVSPPLPAAELETWLKASPWYAGRRGLGNKNLPPFVVQPRGLRPSAAPRGKFRG